MSKVQLPDMTRALLGSTSAAQSPTGASASLKKAATVAPTIMASSLAQSEIGQCFRLKCIAEECRESLESTAEEIVSSLSTSSTSRFRVPSLLGSFLVGFATITSGVVRSRLCEGLSGTSAFGAVRRIVRKAHRPLSAGDIRRLTAEIYQEAKRRRERQREIDSAELWSTFDSDDS